MLVASIPSLTPVFVFPWGCSELPSLESEPPQTCFVGDNVTLTCRVTESTPAARLSWLRDITRPEVEIQPGGRFLITQEGNVSRLTIQNCSQGTDGGCYICKAQNPVGLRELFVCLTVKREWGCGRRAWGHSTAALWLALRIPHPSVPPLRRAREHRRSRGCCGGPVPPGCSHHHWSGVVLQSPPVPQRYGLVPPSWGFILSLLALPSVLKSVRVACAMCGQVTSTSLPLHGAASDHLGEAQTCRQDWQGLSSPVKPVALQGDSF